MGLLNGLIDSLEMASIYALIALALTLGANINGVINFILGPLFVISIYLISFFCDLKLPIVISILIAMIICGVINVFIKKYVYDLIAMHSGMMSVIVSLGLSFIIQDLFVMIFKANPRKLFCNIKGAYKFAFLEINYAELICLGVFLLAIIISYIFMRYVRLGKIIRAVSENSESTALMGIDNNKIINLIYIICAGLVAIAGSFFCLSFTLVDPFSGNMILMRALIGAFIGGLGIVSGSFSKSVVNALCGGFLVGIIEFLVKNYVSVEASDVILFLVLAIYLFANNQKYIRRDLN